MSWEVAHCGNADVCCGLEVRWIDDWLKTGLLTMVLSSRRNFVGAGVSADVVVPIRVSSLTAGQLAWGGQCTSGAHFVEDNHLIVLSEILSEGPVGF